MKNLTVKMKDWFFDRKEVEQLIGKRSAKALGKAMAFVRQRARSILRRRKKPSPAGQPPSVHSESDVASLKNIWFALDPKTLTGVVGPLKLNQVNLTIDNNRITVPQLHEFGGTVGIYEEKFIEDEPMTWTPSALRAALHEGWRRSDLRRNKRENRRYRVRQATYQPRPFMWTALQHEMRKFPQLWIPGAA